MTREEEIRQASIEYTMGNAPKCIGGDDFSEVMDGMNRNHAFEEGAKWADKHPKNPWISAKDDLPCNHPEMLHPNYTDKVIVLSRNGYSEVAFMCLIEDAWEWNTFIKVLYWMPIPEPPKE